VERRLTPGLAQVETLQVGARRVGLAIALHNIEHEKWARVHSVERPVPRVKSPDMPEFPPVSEEVS